MWKPTRWRSWQSNLKTYQRRRDNVTLRRGGDVPQQRYWVFHLGLTGDTYIPLRRLSDVPMRRRWVFHLRCCEDALMRRCCYVLLRPRHNVSRACRGDVPLRCLVFHLRRTCDVAGTYRKTSLCRRHDVLLPGGTELSVFTSITNIRLKLPRFMFKNNCPLNSSFHIFSSLTEECVSWRKMKPFEMT